MFPRSVKKLAQFLCKRLWSTAKLPSLLSCNNIVGSTEFWLKESNAVWSIFRNLQRCWVVLGMYIISIEAVCIVQFTTFQGREQKENFLMFSQVLFSQWSDNDSSAYTNKKSKIESDKTNHCLKQSVFLAEELAWPPQAWPSIAVSQFAIYNYRNKSVTENQPHSTSFLQWT